MNTIKTPHGTVTCGADIEKILLLCKKPADVTFLWEQAVIQNDIKAPKNLHVMDEQSYITSSSINDLELNLFMRCIKCYTDLTNPETDINALATRLDNLCNKGMRLQLVIKPNDDLAMVGPDVDFCKDYLSQTADVTIMAVDYFRSKSIGSPIPRLWFATTDEYDVGCTLDSIQRIFVVDSNNVIIHDLSLSTEDQAETFAILESDNVIPFRYLKNRILKRHAQDKK